jgi:hypothetical protein
LARTIALTAARVIVDDVVRPQQDIDPLARPTRRTGVGQVDRLFAVDRRDLEARRRDASTVAYDEDAATDEVGDEAVARPVVQVVGAVRAAGSGLRA